MFVNYVYIAVNTRGLDLEMIMTTSKSSSVNINTETKQYVKNRTEGFTLLFNAHSQDFSMRKHKNHRTSNKNKQREITHSKQEI